MTPKLLEKVWLTLWSLSAAACAACASVSAETDHVPLSFEGVAHVR